MRRLLNLSLAAVLALSSFVPANAEGMRIFNNAHRPYRLLAKQYATNANVFPIVDPSPAGTPLLLSNAMGLAPSDGVVTFTLDAGWTAPITLTAYYWQADGVTPANACWVRASNVASAYSASVDTNYAQISFSVPGNTPFIVVSSAAVTGFVYCSAPAAPQNPASSVAGY